MRAELSAIQETMEAGKEMYLRLWTGKTNCQYREKDKYLCVLLVLQNSFPHWFQLEELLEA